jgi:hypothetical protein
MGLTGLPETFEVWTIMRQQYLTDNLQPSSYTADLYTQYKKHLGTIRYKVLLKAQALVAPPRVRELLKFKMGFSFSMCYNPI